MTFAIRRVSEEFNALRACPAYAPKRLLAFYIFTGHWSKHESIIAEALERRFSVGPFEDLRGELETLLDPIDEELKSSDSGYLLLSAIQVTWNSYQLHVQQIGSEFAVLCGPSILVPPEQFAECKQILSALPEEQQWHTLPSSGACVDSNQPRLCSAGANSTASAENGPIRIVSSLVWKALLKEPHAFDKSTDFGLTTQSVYGRTPPGKYLEVECE